MSADHSRLNTHSLSFCLHINLAPMSRHFDENSVGDSLTRETGSGGTKSQRDAMPMAKTEKRLNLLNVSGKDDCLWNQAIEASVRGKRNQVNWSRENPLAVDYCGEPFQYWSSSATAGELPVISWS